MRKFLVKVNDQEFEVEVEELNHKEPSKTMASPISFKQKNAQVENGKVLAPMPGVITEKHVKIGDLVHANQTVMTLEAMKMENKLPAGKAGQVIEIMVDIGQTVSAGEILVVIQ